LVVAFFVSFINTKVFPFLRYDTCSCLSFIVSFLDH